MKSDTAVSRDGQRVMFSVDFPNDLQVAGTYKNIFYIPH